MIKKLLVVVLLVAMTGFVSAVEFVNWDGSSSSLWADVENWNYAPTAPAGTPSTAPGVGMYVPLSSGQQLFPLVDFGSVALNITTPASIDLSSASTNNSGFVSFGAFSASNAVLSPDSGRTAWYNHSDHYVGFGSTANITYKNIDMEIDSGETKGFRIDSQSTGGCYATFDNSSIDTYVLEISASATYPAYLTLKNGSTATIDELVFGAGIIDIQDSSILRLQGNQVTSVSQYLDDLDSFIAGNGVMGDVSVTYDGEYTNIAPMAHTPEPATIALLGLGGLCLIRRKR